MIRTAPALQVDVIRQGGAWSRRLVGATRLAERAARAAWIAAGGTGKAEVAVVLADDATLRALNREYRGKDAPTNVLSFPAEESAPAEAPRLLGDVVLALETVLAEAVRDGKAPADHLAHLVVHGVLHLLGHDHEHSAEAKRMESLEVQVLAGLGIADPYRTMAEGGG